MSVRPRSLKASVLRIYIARLFAMLVLILLAGGFEQAQAVGITLVQHIGKDAGTTTTSTLAFPSANAAGNFIAVVIRGGLSNSQVFSVKDSNSNAYKKAVQLGSSGSAVTSAIYYAENIAGGANTITVTMTVSGPLRFAILEYSGVATSNSLDAVVAASATSTSPNSGNLTTTVSGGLLLGEVATADSTTFTGGAGFAVRDFVPAEPNTKLIDEDQIQATVGIASAAATLNPSSNWAALLAAFKPAGGVAGTPASITATAGTPQSATVNTAFSIQFQATVKDSLNNPVSGTTVVFTAPGSGASGTFAGGVTTATTNASGLATAAVFTANTTAGAYTVTATVSGVASPANFSLTNLAGAAASITSTAGTPQSAPVNTAFATQLQATVKDSFNNPVSGATVAFTAPGSGASGTFAGGVTTAITNASGVAVAAVFTANTAAGSYLVTASVSGLGTSASFSLTNLAGSAASITATAGTPQSAPVNTAFATQLQATVKDSFNNPVSGATVTFAAPNSGASGTFAGGVTTATTNTLGVATAAVFTANGTAGSYTVAASVSGVASPANFSLTNLALTPTITGLNPVSGQLGTSVTITGTNFGAAQGASTVTFNGVNAGSTSWSNTSITTVVPDGATSGNVVVTVAGVPSNGANFTLSAPVISFVGPTSGSFLTPVSISGAGFGFSQGSSTVSFGGTLATPTFWNMTSITVPVPTGATSGNIVVTVGGLPSNGVSFTVLPISVSVSPSSPTVITNQSVGYAATVQGDTANLGVTWSLTGAGCSGNACGTLGPATSNHTTSYTAPPTVPNPSTVTITATSVADPTKSATSTVTIVAPTPHITSVSPANGTVGSQVTITGTGFGAFQQTSTVAFNGVQAGATSWSDTSIVAIVPTSATTGNVVVTVSGTPSNGVNFTVSAAAPTITGLSPSSGGIGTLVTVTGTNFGATQGTSTVTFNGVVATPTSWSGTSILVPAPNNATTGPVVLTVGGVASNALTFTVLPPSITSLNPASGVVGTSVMISGTNFGPTQGSSSVEFSAPIGFVFATPTTWSSTSIVVPVPSGTATGNVMVVVSGQNSNSILFTLVPSITALSPTSGAVGTLVTISGKNFGPVQTGTVAFNGTIATPSSWSDTSIVVPVPAGATTGNVIVTFNTIASNGVNFTVTPPPPIINSVGPDPAPVGTPITIGGANFGATQGTSTITFNGIAGAPTSWSATSIVVPVPSGATTGNIIVTVGGSPSNAVAFTVTPNIISLSPTSAPVGNSVTITGTSFGATQGTSTVTFNGTVGNPSSWSDTSIFVLVPNGATTGNVVVTVSGVASNGVALTVLPTPNIASITPGGAQVGASVTITGTNFGASQGTSTVTFNVTQATPTSWSPTSITVPVPAGASSGNVVVAVNAVQSNAVPFTVVPKVANLSANSGTPGTTITIGGSSFGSFVAGDTVTFNGTLAQTGIWTDTSINATVPAGAATGPVVVTVGGSPSNNNINFIITPVTITALSPTSGPAGTSVTITGTNFGPTQGTSNVAFGGLNAAVTSWSQTSILCTVPAGLTGTNVVTVNEGVVGSNGVNFSIPAPTITSLNPTSGLFGTSVTITGTSFGSGQQTSTLTLNSTPLGITSWSDTSMVAFIPNGATTGPVVVTTNSGASNGITFTVIPPPNIATLSPASGPAGTVVTVSGTSFGSTQGTSKITFNGTVASPTSWSDTSITVPVPAGSTTGSVVVTRNGVASNGVNFTVAPPPPSINTLSPSSAAVGAFVLISGANFGSSQGTSTVTFNGTSAGSIAPTSWTSVSITVQVPIGAATGNVVVTVGGVASNGVLFTITPPPSIASLNAVSGPVGTPVTITGSSFGVAQGTSAVLFNGTTATVTNWSDTSITATVPTGATTGNVVVDASGVNSNGVLFTVGVPPSITSLSLTSGPVGTSVTITGTSFGASQGTSTVTFNGTTATPTSWSATSIVVPVPSGATSGNVVVTVGGVASNGVPFTVTTPPANIALVQHKGLDAGTATTATLAFASATTAGNFIAVVIRGGNSNAQVFTVRDSISNTYKQAKQLASSGSAVTSAIYYAENVKGGANTVTVTMTVSGPLRFAILEYSGVATSNSLDAAIAATTTSTSPNSGNLTTTANGDLLLGDVATADSDTYTAGTGFTIRDVVPAAPSTKLVTEDQVQSAAGTTSASATLSVSSNWAAILAAFKPATGGGGAGTPASIAATAGTTQSATVNTAFAAPLQATVKDSLNNPVSGVTVTFTAPGSGASGTFVGGVNTATTNASGVATSAAFTANTVAGGPYTVTASVSGVSTPANFSLTNLAGGASSITATVGTPQSATINTAFATQLQATVRDSFNNPVSGVTVTFMAPGNGASGTFAGGVNAAITNASGVAIAAVFTANGATGSYTVTALASGVASPANFSLTNVSAPPASISAIAGTPQSATVNTAFTTALQATVKDASNNPVSGVTVAFTAPASGASSTFAGGVNTATTNSLGVATSAVFTANATAGSYTLTGSVSGVATPANFSLTNLAGSAANITATAGTPQSAVINTAFAAPLQATVTDSLNNPVSGITVLFTAPVGGASGTFAGGVNTATTNAQGIATASAFTANSTVGGPYTVTASASGVAAQVNFSLTNLSAAGNIALVQHRNIDASTATSNSLAFATNTTSGNFIAVCIRAGGSSSQVFTVTDSSGNTYRQAFKKGLVNTVETFAIYYAENIIGGPDAIHVQQSVNASLRFIILEYSGVATSNSLDGTVSAEGSNATPSSGNLTTTANGDLLLAAMMTKNIAVFTAHNGFTIEEAVQASPNTRLIAEDQLQSIAGTVSASASVPTSDNWGAGLAAFRSISGSVAPISVSVSPGSGSFPSGYGAQAFAATVTNDFLNRGVTWSLSGAGCSGAACGSLSRVTTTSVTYIAPSNIPSPATLAVTATSIGDTTKSASATITVAQGVLTVVLNPKRAAVTLASPPVQFAANVYNDPQNLGVTWQVDGNNGGTSASGTISATGLYTPGTQPGAHTVTAVSNANASVSGSALIAVTDLTGVYTHHNDNARTGQNLKEYGLTPPTVNSLSFGQLFSCPVDGNIYAQPLWVANLNFGGTTRNAIFVATEHDSVYAFDADSPSCVQLWKMNFLSSGVTTLTPADVASNNDFYPEIGITSTPVIDPATSTLYVVPKTRETVGTVNGQACSTGTPCYVHRLHALDLFSGAEKFGGPVVINAANFNSQKHLQRPALLLANNTLYLAFGSHGDQCPYQGWVMGYNPSTLAQTFAKALSDPTSGCNQGAIWLSGGGPSADANGNVYIVTANGLYDGNLNFGDTVAKLSPTGSLLDWFTPFNQATLAANDVDLGSSAVLILPDSVGSTTHPHLAVTMGKTAVVYLLDQANLGKFNSSVSNDVQEVIPVPPMNTTMDDGGNYVGPAYWNGSIYVTGQNYPLSQFQISNGVIATPQFAASSNTFPPRGGAPVVSANGSTGGVLWIIDYTGFQNNTAAILYAYDAANVGTLLYSSPASGSGAAGNGVKFTVPTVANSKVYVGGQLSFTVYGLLPN